MIKILNLYAGIGGNRKLWPNDQIEVTAVELNPEIAKMYKDFFPMDNVIVADAHQYLLEHYKEFDFIWASPPCPTHSRMRKSAMSFSNGENIAAVYPDMKLYEEILFLDGYFKGKWAIENVISWYDPLIRPYRVGRHYLWANFVIPEITDNTNNAIGFSFSNVTMEDRQHRKGFDISAYSGVDKEKILNNCVEPEMGLHIFNCAFKEKQHTLNQEWRNENERDNEIRYGEADNGDKGRDSGSPDDNSGPCNPNGQCNNPG